MLQIQNFKLSHPSFSLECPELFFPDKGLFVFSGYNGSGKSSFFRVLIQLNKNYQGTIVLNNQELKEISYPELIVQISYLPQKLQNLPQITGQEFITQGTYLQPKITNESQEEFLIDFLGVHKLLDKNCASLSGGEQQMLTIIRNLMLPKPIILLDEPESSLSKKNREKLISLITHLSKKSLVLVVSHFAEFYPQKNIIHFEEIDDNLFQMYF